MTLIHDEGQTDRPIYGGNKNGALIRGDENRNAIKYGIAGRVRPRQEKP
jgi:hypothetical protein